MAAQRDCAHGCGPFEPRREDQLYCRQTVECRRAAGAAYTRASRAPIAPPQHRPVRSIELVEYDPLDWTSHIVNGRGRWKEPALAARAILKRTVPIPSAADESVTEYLRLQQVARVMRAS